jgi:type IV secretion system protein VirB2
MNTLNSTPAVNSKRFSVAYAVSIGFLILLFATDVFAFSGSQTKVTTFFTNIQSILTVASIAIVTIAIIFAGYQIAFANKRITDVLPILIGGLLIGAAAQIAAMLLA